MTEPRVLVVLDGLFDDLDLETAVAASKGWSVARWDGTEASLRGARVVLHVRTRIDKAMLGRMPACKVVARFGTGLDTVDQTAAAERGIRVVGVRDYCIPELTTHTLGLAFALDRRLDAVRDGRLGPDDTWQQVASRLPLPGRTVATVIGFGSIGAAVTRALLAVNLSVRVVTQHGADAARRFGAMAVSLDEGLADAGFIFLHSSLGPSTAGLIDRARLARIASGAILINTARIGLIDEAAVAAALGEGRLAGLGLDAKLGADSPLRGFLDDPRVLVTPHIGWYSARSARELRERTVQAAIAAALELETPASSHGEQNNERR
jgi:D-3-phosphoglycerate dehydrogenase